jgi:hypothetical protein
MVTWSSQVGGSAPVGRRSPPPCSCKEITLRRTDIEVPADLYAHRDPESAASRFRISRDTYLLERYRAW